MSFDNYQAFGSHERPSGQHETYIGVPGDPHHGHVVWHDGPNGPVYDHVRDAQGNIYANRPSELYRFLGNTAMNER